MKLNILDIKQNHKEELILYNHVKCKTNDCDNSSIQQLSNKNNANILSVSIKNEKNTENDIWENIEKVTFAQNKMNEDVENKLGDVKEELEIYPFEMVEVQTIKTENTDEDDKDEDTSDPIQMNEGN